MAKKKKAANIAAGIKGIVIPCSGARNKKLEKLSIDKIKFSDNGAGGGVITVELLLKKVTMVLENDPLNLKDKEIFFQVESDGTIKGDIDSPAAEIKGANRTQIKGVEGGITFNFGASKVGPGSGI